MKSKTALKLLWWFLACLNIGIFIGRHFVEGNMGSSWFNLLVGGMVLGVIFADHVNDKVFKLNEQIIALQMETIKMQNALIEKQSETIQNLMLENTINNQYKQN